MSPDLPPAVCIGEAEGPDGWGCREEQHGHVLLDLHGDDADVGRLYAELLRPELSTRYVPMMRRMWDELPGVFGGILRAHARRYPEAFDQPTRARAASFEATLGLAPGTWEDWAWITELSSVGPGLLIATASRCTSVVGREGDATVHARNFDYWGMDYWQPNATVVFVDPRDAEGRSSGFRYASLGTVGELFGGSTSVNEPGLVVTTHLNASRDVAILDGRSRMSMLTLLSSAWLGPRRQVGTSIYAVVERLLRHAPDVARAVDLLEGTRTLGAWTLVLSDPSGERAVVGITQREVRALRGESVATNFYLDEAMRAREFAPVRGPVEGAHRRYDRARTLLEGLGGRLGLAEAVAILRDRFDTALGEDRAVSPNTIVSPDTSQSVVVVTRPGGDHDLWIAEPHLDGRTPAPLAPFFGIRFRDGFTPGGVTLGSVAFAPDPALEPVAAGYVAAMSALIDADDARGAWERLRALDTQDGGVLLMRAWLGASIGDTGAATEDLAAARSRPLAYHHVTLAEVLAGELARARRDPPAALAAFERALASLEAEGTYAGADAMLATALQARIAREGRGRPVLPAPDLKFQDVLGLIGTR
ncbi:MAG: carcinine hydrolase/isopenicillin-N N-acyltransferase family protein [Myxococcota bacterium]